MNASFFYYWLHFPNNSPKLLPEIGVSILLSDEERSTEYIIEIQLFFAETLLQIFCEMVKRKKWLDSRFNGVNKAVYLLSSQVVYKIDWFMNFSIRRLMTHDKIVCWTWIDHVKQAKGGHVLLPIGSVDEVVVIDWRQFINSDSQHWSIIHIWSYIFFRMLIKVVMN